MTLVLGLYYSEIISAKSFTCNWILKNHFKLHMCSNLSNFTFVSPWLTNMYIMNTQGQIHEREVLGRLPFTFGLYLAIRNELWPWTLSLIIQILISPPNWMYAKVYARNGCVQDQDILIEQSPIYSNRAFSISSTMSNISLPINLLFLYIQWYALVYLQGLYDNAHIRHWLKSQWIFFFW